VIEEELQGFCISRFGRIWPWWCALQREELLSCRVPPAGVSWRDEFWTFVEFRLPCCVEKSFLNLFGAYQVLTLLGRKLHQVRCQPLPTLWHCYGVPLDKKRDLWRISCNSEERIMCSVLSIERPRDAEWARLQRIWCVAYHERDQLSCTSRSKFQELHIHRFENR
jgi:hypothetical protein